MMQQANPLSSQRGPQAQAEHPMMMHAKVWQSVNAMPADQVAQKADQVAHVLPLLGTLAGNPDVTRKDVIKAAADAAGSGRVPPSQVVAFLAQMPDDPEKLQPWLRAFYAANMTALVHLKAAQMQGQRGVPQQGAVG